MCSWACVATKVGDFLRRPLVMSDENVLVAAPHGFVIMRLRHPLPISRDRCGTDNRVHPGA